VAPSVTGAPALERRGDVLVHRVPTVRFPFGHDLRLTMRLDAVRYAVLGARPDVVQVHHPFPLSAATRMTARAAGIPSVAVNHTIPECFFYAYRRVPIAYPAAVSLFRRYLGAMQDEIRHGAPLKVRGTLNDKLLLLGETGVESISLGRRRSPLPRPGRLGGLWHAMISITSVR